MTCKDCLHYDVCYHIEHYGRLTETEEPCGGFKNKADFVEVVRCKDCKNYKPQAKSAHWNSEKRYCCRCATVKVSDNDFCSYGQRK